MSIITKKNSGYELNIRSEIVCKLCETPDWFYWSLSGVSFVISNYY